MLRSLQAGSRSLLTSMGLACAVLLLSAAGALQTANLFFADFLARRLPERPGLTDQLLLVTAENGAPLTAEEWRQLLARLAALGARVIALTARPAVLADATLAEVAAPATLVIGSPAIPNVLDPSRYDDPGRDRDQGTAAPVVVPTPVYGVYREQWAAAPTLTARLETLEVVAARALGSAVEPAANGRFLLDFSYLPASLPRVGARRALAGGLVAEMVAGRCVLIETRGSPDTPGLYTPISAEGMLLAPLEFHAYALNTLLNDRALAMLPLPTVALLILVVAAGGFIGFQRLDTRSELSTVLLAGIVYLPLAWFAYHHLRTIPPTAEIFLTLIALLGYIFGARAQRERRSLGTLIVESSARLQRMVLPTTFYDSAQYWNEVIRMVDQTLSLHRAIFLERVPGDHRLKEVIALNCDIADINEKRRDYERSPYTTAIAEHGPIQVDDYLDHATPATQQFLVPLLAVGEVQGFWAFEVTLDVLADTPGFSTSVKDFGDQIAQLLYHRRLWNERQRESRSRLRRYLELQAGDPEYRRLQNSVTLIEQRLGTLERLFDGLATPTILYDLFGRVLQVNRQMTDVLRAAELKPFEVTAGDLVGQLAELPLDKVRPMMRRLVLQKQTISLQSRVLRGRHYVMRLRSLTGHDPRLGPDELVPTTLSPFQVEGILLELMDITDIRNLRRLKEDLLQRTFFTFNNDIGSGLLAASLLKEPGFTIDDRFHAIDILVAKLEDMHRTLYEVRDFFGGGFDADADEIYPINAVVPLGAVLVELAEPARLRGITFRNELPELMNLVLAPPARFAAVIRALVTYLLRDAVTDSVITVSVDYAGEMVAFELSNTGFGVPQDRMDDYMISDDEPDAPELRELRAAAREVTQWGGALEATSAVGSGTTLVLNLKGLA